MNNYQSGVARQSNMPLTGNKFNKKLFTVVVLTAIAVSSVLTSCKKESSDVTAPELKLNTERALNPSQGQTLSLTDVDSGKVHRNSSDVYTVTNYFVSQGIYSGSGNHVPNGIYILILALTTIRKAQQVQRHH